MKTYELLLQDETAISILDRIPETERSRVVEKYIIIGDTVIRYASIVTSEESIKQFFSPLIDNLQKLMKTFDSIPQKLSSQIPDTIKATLNETVGQLKAQVQALEKLYPEISRRTRTEEKGAAACEDVLSSLKEAFPGDDFEQVQHEERSMDILARPFRDSSILIEVKNWESRVTTEQVDKFWRDMKSERHGARVGCFISLHTPIVGKSSPLSIETRGSHIGVFVVSAKMEYLGHIFAYVIARKILEIMRERGKVESAKIEWMTRVLQVHIDEFRQRVKDLEQIKTDLEKAQQEATKAFQTAISSVANIYGKLEEIIKLTLADLSED